MKELKQTKIGEIPNSPFVHINLFQRWNDPLELALALSPKKEENDWRIAAIGKFQKHREAWALSRFAFGYQKFFEVKTQIKMVDDREQSPDGLVKIGSKEVPFEITMVLNPERRMALEVKEAAENVRKAENGGKLKFERMHYPATSELLDWIKAGLKRKQRGIYPGLHLLIYLNTWRQQLDYRDLAALASEANAWSDVWIICSSGWDEQYALTAITNNRISGWFEFQLTDSKLPNGWVKR